MKVVNNSAERAIALMQQYNSSLTKNEEQKQYLLWLVTWKTQKAISSVCQVYRSEYGIRTLMVKNTMRQQITVQTISIQVVVNFTCFFCFVSLISAEFWFSACFIAYTSMNIVFTKIMCINKTNPSMSDL